MLVHNATANKRRGPNAKAIQLNKEVLFEVANNQ